MINEINKISLYWIFCEDSYYETQDPDYDPTSELGK